MRKELSSSAYIEIHERPGNPSTLKLIYPQIKNKKLTLRFQIFHKHRMLAAGQDHLILGMPLPTSELKRKKPQ
jgi:hypothetical protein